MANFNRGEKSPQWKGGRRLGTNGYVMVRVDEGHHLRMRNGYAYEHQLVAELMLGRRLIPGEVVHHKDGDKANNAQSNLEVSASHAEHMLHHRKRGDLRLPGESNEQVECACGCGEKLLRFDATGRPRKFIRGHHARVLPPDSPSAQARFKPKTGRPLK